MEVKVHLYGHLKYQSKMPQPFQVELELGTTGRELFKRLDINENEVVLFAVNGKLRDLDEKLESGDQVALFPPVDGG